MSKTDFKPETEVVVCGSEMVAVKTIYIKYRVDSTSEMRSTESRDKMKPYDMLPFDKRYYARKNIREVLTI